MGGPECLHQRGEDAQDIAVELEEDVQVLELAQGTGLGGVQSL